MQLGQPQPGFSNRCLVPVAAVEQTGREMRNTAYTAVP